jgi:hypothetical protein
MAAGYSGTPLPKKLGIGEGARVVVIGAPRGFELGTLPTGATLAGRLAGTAPYDVLVAFCGMRATFERGLATWRARMTPAAGLWIAWPKKASGVATDMTEHVVREVALPTGLVDNKVCAIDETWSGLRLVIRVELRGQA